MDDEEKNSEETHNEENEQKKQENHDQGNEKKDSQNDGNKEQLSQEELKQLLKEMKKLEVQNKKSKNNKGPKMIKLEFGTLFHGNPILNVLMYFFLNLVVIYSIMELFDFVEFTADLMVIFLFVLTYTVLEVTFRQYLVKHHFKFVLRTLGFVFFFGYLSIFYLLDAYVFEENIRFVNETLLVIFVGFFIVFRYILSILVKTLLIKMKG